MTLELIVITAFVARTAAPEVQLAAWGVAFAISTLIQAPATALLPTSTALSTNLARFGQLRTYVHWLLAGLTTMHVLVVFTPLYDVITRGVMGLPEDVAIATRPALAFMTPWAIGTGYRRFLQGVLIRFGEVRVVIAGSLYRLAIGTTVLTIGTLTNVLPGAQLAAIAIIIGVITEMQYTRSRFAVVTPARFGAADATQANLTLSRFMGFMYPLVVMTLLTMIVQSLVTVVLGRMPNALESLAVWPVLFGLLVWLQSSGLAFTEVVISLLDRPRAVPALRRFTWMLAGGVTLALLMLALTPLSDAWFRHVSGLNATLAEEANRALLIAAAIPGLRVLHGWYQGGIMHGGNNRGILESVMVFLVIATITFAIGIATAALPGLHVGVIGITLAMLGQAWWLRRRVLPILQHEPATPATITHTERSAT